VSFTCSSLRFLFITFSALSAFNSNATSLFSDYEGNGLTYSTADNQYSVQIRGRAQFRFASPGAGQPNDIGDFIAESDNQFDINRARLKVGGHAVREWVKYYWEYDAADSRTLNATIALEKHDGLKMKFGQWKVEYSRERSVSSGGQQMMDRSIIN